jgi:hypothetical protein
MRQFIRHLAFVIRHSRQRPRPRGLAVNSIATEFQSRNGSGSYIPDAAIANPDYGVKIGSSDRNIAVIANAADIPVGILLHDFVSSGDVGVVQKKVALFGLYPETLPFVASGAIAAEAEVAPDPANPGQFMQLPDGSNGTAKVPGSYYVVGRNRFNIAAAQDPTQPNDRGNLIHKTPSLKIVSAVVLGSAATANATDLPSSEALANALKADLAAIKAALGI